MRLRKLLRIKGHKRANNKKAKEIIETTPPEKLKAQILILKKGYGIAD